MGKLRPREDLLQIETDFDLALIKPETEKLTVKVIPQQRQTPPAVAAAQAPKSPAGVPAKPPAGVPAKLPAATLVTGVQSKASMESLNRSSALKDSR